MKKNNKLIPYPLLLIFLTTLLLTACDYELFEENEQNTMKNEQTNQDPQKIVEISSDVTAFQKGLGYIKKNNQVFYQTVAFNGEDYQDIPLDEADIASFTILDKYYAKDKHGVFFKGIRFSADTETFKALKFQYGMDKNNLYYQHQKIEDITPENIDPTTFEALSFEFIRSKNGVYKINNFRAKQLQISDPLSFKIINYAYAKDKNSVYQYLPFFRNIENVDPASFTVIGRDFVKDKNHVYWINDYVGIQTIEYLDPRTVKLIDNSYIGDDKSVYLIEYNRLVKVEKTNTETIEVLNEYLTKDKENVYYKGKKIEGALPASFEVVNYFYAKDAQSVYYYDFRYLEKLPEADPISWRFLGNFYSKDNKNAYYQKWPVKGADGETFVPFMTKTNYYAKDKNHVYNHEDIMEGKDPQTFTPPED